MRKQDLKSGMIVETEGNRFYLVVNEILCGSKGFLTLNNYTDDLKNVLTCESFNFDIVRIYKPIAKNLIYLVDRLNEKEGLNELELLCDLKKNKIDWSEVELNSPVEISTKNGKLKYLLHFARKKGYIIEFYSDGKTSYTYDKIEGFNESCFDFKLL